MNMHEATDEVIDTFSLSDIHIYSDPSSSSKEEQDHGSISSFQFKIAGSLPSEKFVFYRNVISLPENHRKPHFVPQKPSRTKAFPMHDRGRNSGGRRITGRRGFLMFGMGGSQARMEVFDLHDRDRPPRIVPVNSGGGEEVTVRRKSGNWVGKLFGRCFPKL